MNKIILALAVILLIACAPTKQTLRSDTQIEQSAVVTTESVTKQRDQVAEYWSNLARELQERNVRIVHTVYDTTQPPDSTTGKPPIASEMIVTDNYRVTSSADSQSSIKLINAKDSMGVTDVKIDTKIDVTEKTIEKQGSSTALAWVIIALIIVIAALLLLRKFR